MINETPVNAMLMYSGVFYSLLKQPGIMFRRSQNQNQSGLSRYSRRINSSKLLFKKDTLVADVAEAAPEAGSLAASGALGVAAGAARRRVQGAEDVAGATTANVRDGRGLLANLGTLELLIEGDSLALRGRMDVAGTAAARVETGRGGLGLSDVGNTSRNARRSGGLRGTEEVASTATARVSVAVLGNGGVRLGDSNVGRHLVFGCVFFWCLVGVKGLQVARWQVLKY